MAAAYNNFNVDSSHYHLEIASKSELVKFITSSALVVAIYYLMLPLIIDDTPFLSFVSFTVLGYIPVFIYSRILLEEKFAIQLVSFAYMTKSVIGILFYILFIDPNYFSDGTVVVVGADSDYNAMYEQITKYAEVFDFTYDSLLMNLTGAPNHLEIYGLMSLAYRYSGGYYLTIAPMNVIFSLLMAIIIAYITKLRDGNYRLALLLALFFPMSLTSTLLFRDVLGVLFVTFGAALIVLASRTKLLMIAIASYLSYLQRTPYVVMPLAAYVLYLVLQKKGKNTRLIAITVALIAIILLISSAAFLGQILEKGNYTSAQSNPLTYILFPIRYFITIIGPFPWTQAFGDEVVKRFYWQDFVFSSALFLITFKYFPVIWKKITRKESVDYLTVLGLLFMLMGVMTTPPHMTYVGFGLCFFLPTFVNYINIKQIGYFTLRYFSFMIIFNTLYVSFGLGGIFKAIF